MSNKGRF